MADVFDGPFAGLSSSLTAVLVQNTKDELNGEIDKIIALITPQSATTQNSMPSPDFDQIPPHTAEKLIAELTALQALIESADET